VGERSPATLTPLFGWRIPVEHHRRKTAYWLSIIPTSVRAVHSPTPNQDPDLADNFAYAHLAGTGGDEVVDRLQLGQQAYGAGSVLSGPPR
jgi:hypothetical protein